MPGYYLLGIVFALIGMFVQSTLKSKFQKYSRTRTSAGLTGREIAEKMLHENGIYDVKVISTAGELTDHYNPTDKTVNLSEWVYNERSAAAAAVAAHECGHAVQHARAYSMLTLRSQMVPLLSVTSRFMPWIILIGLFALRISTLPLTIGVILFGATTLFSFITLPVEFDASARALSWMKSSGVVTKEEYGQSKDALTWAALTYVAAALGSLASLLYYVSILNSRRS